MDEADFQYLLKDSLKSEDPVIMERTSVALVRNVGGNSIHNTIREGKVLQRSRGSCAKTAQNEMQKQQDEGRSTCIL